MYTGLYFWLAGMDVNREFIICDHRYWKMNPSKAESSAWDSAVHQASEEYSNRMVGVTQSWLSMNKLAEGSHSSPPPPPPPQEITFQN